MSYFPSRASFGSVRPPPSPFASARSVGVHAARSPTPTYASARCIGVHAAARSPTPASPRSPLQALARSPITPTRGALRDLITSSREPTPVARTHYGQNGAQANLSSVRVPSRQRDTAPLEVENQRSSQQRDAGGFVARDAGGFVAPDGPRAGAAEFAYYEVPGVSPLKDERGRRGSDPLCPIPPSLLNLSPFGKQAANPPSPAPSTPKTPKPVMPKTAAKPPSGAYVRSRRSGDAPPLSPSSGAARELRSFRSPISALVSADSPLRAPKLGGDRFAAHPESSVRDVYKPQPEALRTPSPLPRPSCAAPGSPTPESPLTPQFGEAFPEDWSDLAAHYAADVHGEAVEAEERKALGSRTDVLKLRRAFQSCFGSAEQLTAETLAGMSPVAVQEAAKTMVAAKAALAKASFEEALEQKTAAVEHAIEKVMAARAAVSNAATEKAGRGREKAAADGTAAEVQTPVRPHTESTPVRIAAQKAAADEAAAEVRAAMAEIEAGERAVAETAAKETAATEKTAAMLYALGPVWSIPVEGALPSPERMAAEKAAADEAASQVQTAIMEIAAAKRAAAEKAAEKAAAEKAAAESAGAERIVWEKTMAEKAAAECAATVKAAQEKAEKAVAERLAAEKAAAEKAAAEIAAVQKALAEQKASERAAAEKAAQEKAAAEKAAAERLAAEKAAAKKAAQEKAAAEIAAAAQVAAAREAAERVAAEKAAAEQAEKAAAKAAALEKAAAEKAEAAKTRAAVEEALERALKAKACLESAVESSSTEALDAAKMWLGTTKWDECPAAPTCLANPQAAETCVEAPPAAPAASLESIPDLELDAKVLATLPGEIPLQDPPTCSQSLRVGVITEDDLQEIVLPGKHRSESDDPDELPLKDPKQSSCAHTVSTSAGKIPFQSLSTRTVSKGSAASSEAEAEATPKLAQGAVMFSEAPQELTRAPQEAEKIGQCPDETCRAENPDHFNPTRAKFCILCGTKMPARTPPTPMPGRFRTSRGNSTAKVGTTTLTEEPLMMPFPYGANIPPECKPVVCACDGCHKCSTGLAGPYRDDTFFADMDALEDFRKLLQFETLILRAATDE